MNKVWIPALAFLLLLGCEKKQNLQNNGDTPEPLEIPVMSDNSPELLEDRPPRADRRGTAEINFFYMETCPSCEEYVQAKTIRDTFIEAARKGFLPWIEVSFSSSNVLTDEQVVELEEFLQEHNLPAVGLSLPLLIINDAIVVGYDEIEILLDSLLDY